MKKIILLFFIASRGAGFIQAQEYIIKTNQEDSFSIALVTLLNAAADRFSHCKGELIRSTSLMGDDYNLTISFPGSVMGIVRCRDWDKNAYVEFRGFPDKIGLAKGVSELLDKIRKALGDRLYDPNKGKELPFYGMYLKDSKDYFSMNLEIFSSSSSAPVYLLGPEREDERKPTENFILLKVYGGIPDYQYYVPAGIISPANDLHKTLLQLLHEAETDFDSLRFKNTAMIWSKSEKTDTLKMNGHDVLMNFRGANYSANLLFPAAIDSIAFKDQWELYQTAIQAAAGSSYVYHFFTSRDKPAVLYYSQRYETNKPVIYLEQEKEDNGPSFIKISIRSVHTHETKRGLDSDD